MIKKIEKIISKKYFYQLDGEGIIYELVAFAKAIELNKNDTFIESHISRAICKIMEDFSNNNFNRILQY